MLTLWCINLVKITWFSFSLFSLYFTVTYTLIHTYSCIFYSRSYQPRRKENEKKRKKCCKHLQFCYHLSAIVVWSILFAGFQDFTELQFSNYVVGRMHVFSLVFSCSSYLEVPGYVFFVTSVDGWCFHDDCALVNYQVCLENKEINV